MVQLVITLMSGRIRLEGVTDAGHLTDGSCKISMKPNANRGIHGGTETRSLIDMGTRSRQTEDISGQLQSSL